MEAERLYLRCRGWEEYVNYYARAKRGSSTKIYPLKWTPIYAGLLDDAGWGELTDEGKLLLICVWSLTGRLGDGKVPADAAYIARRASLHGPIDLAELIIKGWMELVDCDGVPASESQHSLRFGDLYRDLHQLVASRTLQQQNRRNQAESEDHSSFTSNRCKDGALQDKDNTGHNIRSISSASSSLRALALTEAQEIDLQDRTEELCGHQARLLLDAMGDWTPGTVSRLIAQKKRGATEADYADARAALAAKGDGVKNRGAYACAVIDERLNSRPGAA